MFGNDDRVENKAIDNDDYGDYDMMSCFVIFCLDSKMMLFFS